LDEAGWVMNEDTGYRAKDGQDLVIEFATTTATFRQTWAAVWEQQMGACGVMIKRMHVPASWWFGDTTGLARRDFELGAFAWVGQADPSGQTLYACAQIPSPQNGWTGQNYMGWCNDAASKNIILANNTLNRDERIAAYTVVQAEYTKDVPAIPLFNRTETYAYRADFENFEVYPGDAYYNWNAYEWAVPGQDTIVIAGVQEPASLYALVEDAQVARSAFAFVMGHLYTGHNYDYQARIQKEMSTLESGLAVNNDVEVAAGEIVQDVNGEFVELAAGVTVRNAAGEEVEFTGDPVTMKQLVVKYEVVDGLTWSDGTLVSNADLALGYKQDCDPASGATSFITCDQVLSLELLPDSVGYTVTYKPGVQTVFYMLFPFFIYPAHRVIESEGPNQGKTLADVPAADWSTLYEIAESPLGYGPYMITEWVKGEKLVFEPNPYFYLGAPATPNIVIRIISAENAEAQLLAGEVDLLDSTILAGLSQTLVDAETSGDIVTLIEPSGTWEHIDMNMFLK